MEKELYIDLNGEKRLLKVETVEYITGQPAYEVALGEKTLILFKQQEKWCSARENDLPEGALQQLGKAIECNL